MKNFGDRLYEACAAKNSCVCVGLDPRLDKIPSQIREKALSKNKNTFKAAAEAVLEFNKGIIDAVYDLVPAVKPQIAFYEMFAEEGIRVFRETIDYAKSKGLITIADVKRNDIGSTAEAYAHAFLGEVDLFGEKVKVFDADAVTLTPYLGWDGIKPFMEACIKYGKGMFILVKTSNPSSGDVQDLCMKDSRAVYEIMGHYIESWGADDIGKNGFSPIGAVVGATYPDQSKHLRKIMPSSFFLVPGYGAQGGTAKDVKNCFIKDSHGVMTGAIVNSSREIIFAYEKSEKYDEKEYDKAAREAVEKMNEDLGKALK
jgi:orotidine-5'-phosphate decarboxylase